jgi:cytochrome c oxidase cbb3-type subunit III
MLVRAFLAGAMLTCLPLALSAQAPEPAASARPTLLAQAPESAASARLTLLAQAPEPAAGAPPAQISSVMPASAASAAQGPPANPPAGPPRGAQAVREFLGLGPPPDPAAAKRGAPIFAANCAFCHGPQARGAEGPSLIYSELVLKDAHGSTVAEFLATGRPEKGMPSFATLSNEQRKDIAEFLHQQVEDVANRGTYEIKNIVLGNPAKGASYVAAHCLSCHSVSGDLKGLGANWRPADLQRYWIMPPRTPGRAITATVHNPQHTWEGPLQQIDDFRVSLVDKSGQLVVVERNAAVTVELHDPLAPHVAMIGNLKDPDMINVTAYLESLK